MHTDLSLNVMLRGILLSRFKYRDRSGIVEDILDSVNSDPKGKTKTSIMRSANLNLDQADTYLQLLIISGLIKKADPLRSQETARYRMTQKGLMFAKDIEKWRYLFAHPR